MRTFFLILKIVQQSYKVKIIFKNHLNEDKSIRFLFPETACFKSKLFSSCVSILNQ